jgi:hypothetical protein
VQLPGETANASKCIGMHRLFNLEKFSICSMLTEETDGVFTVSINVSLASILSIEAQVVRTPLLGQASTVECLVKHC